MGGQEEKCVNVERLNIRSNSDLDSDIVGVLKKGEKVAMKETLGDWILLETGGWVNQKFLTSCVERQPN